MIQLYGLYEGRFGKAHKFQADSWQLPEFLPASHSWFQPDMLAEEPGRGWIVIADWLAKKNRWNETEPGDPSPYAVENYERKNGSGTDAPSARTSDADG